MSEKDCETKNKSDRTHMFRKRIQETEQKSERDTFLLREHFENPTIIEVPTVRTYSTN